MAATGVNTPILTRAQLPISIPVGLKITLLALYEYKHGARCVGGNKFLFIHFYIEPFTSYGVNFRNQVHNAYVRW